MYQVSSSSTLLPKARTMTRNLKIGPLALSSSGMTKVTGMVVSVAPPLPSESAAWVANPWLASATIAGATCVCRRERERERYGRINWCVIQDTLHRSGKFLC